MHGEILIAAGVIGVTALGLLPLVMIVVNERLPQRDDPTKKDDDP